MDEAAVDGQKAFSVGRPGGANDRAASHELGFRGVAECACASPAAFSGPMPSNTSAVALCWAGGARCTSDPVGALLSFEGEE
jgi:hypothetical protein